MICPYCGQENPDTDDICGFCGGPLAVPGRQSDGEAPPLEPVVEVVQSTEAEQPQLASIQPPAPPPTGIYENRIWWIGGCLLFLFLILGCIVLGWGLYRYSGIAGLLKPATVTPMPLFSLTATDIFIPDLPAMASSTPIGTQVKSPAQTQAVISTLSIATPAAIFFDDFSDPNSGWDQVNQADYSTDYYQGTYRISIKTKMSDSWANPPELSLGDVRVEVEATKNSGPDDNDFGLICRYLGTDRFYYAVISSDGYYGITKVTSESTKILGRDYLDYSDLINQGSATNHIRFDCIGDVLTLYINGQLLDEQTDGEYTSGSVGLIAGTYNTPGTDILFDNFGVYSP